MGNCHARKKKKRMRFVYGSGGDSMESLPPISVLGAGLVPSKEFATPRGEKSTPPDLRVGTSEDRSGSGKGPRSERSGKSELDARVVGDSSSLDRRKDKSVRRRPRKREEGVGSMIVEPPTSEKLSSPEEEGEASPALRPKDGANPKGRGDPDEEEERADPSDTATVEVDLSSPLPTSSCCTSPSSASPEPKVRRYRSNASVRAHNRRKSDPSVRWTSHTVPSRRENRNRDLMEEVMAGSLRGLRSPKIERNRKGHKTTTTRDAKQ